MLQRELPSVLQHLFVQEAALALAPGVTSAAADVDDEDDEELLDPAERRARRVAAAGSRPPIYNAEAMHEKLEDISWPSEVLPTSSRKDCPFLQAEFSLLPTATGTLRGPLVKIGCSGTANCSLAFMGTTGNSHAITWCAGCLGREPSHHRRGCSSGRGH